MLTSLLPTIWVCKGQDCFEVYKDEPNGACEKCGSNTFARYRNDNHCIMVADLWKGEKDNGKG